MDARVREGSQLRRTSIKRPWEEISLPEDSNASYPASLPPLGSVPYRRFSIPQGNVPSLFSEVRYGPDSDEPPVIKKHKNEGFDHISAPQYFSDIGRASPVPQSNLAYSHHSDCNQTPIFPPTQKATAAEGPAESQSISNLCVSCSRLATHNNKLDLLGASETHGFLLEVCTQMNQLAATLCSGISAEQRGIIRGIEQSNLDFADFPPIEQFGVNQRLKWILSRITQCNYMVDELVKQVPAGKSHPLEKASLDNGSGTQDADIMKRRFDLDPEEAFRISGENVESMSDARSYSRRRSAVKTPVVGEDNPNVRPQLDYHPSLQSSESHVARISIMNPPPAPTRQLPSPPGRTFPSPTSINFPSPSIPQYGNPAQGANLPPPPILHHSTINNFLPPIAAARSPDSALREHSAALQHEVSVQKIALSSLQGEHDKLLAAFSRSQTRASALEKKHAVSDSEIISLTEEKLRLQTQVIELERDVDELSRSRDEFRQAAVQEGSQYVEIVKKASHLEKMAADERKAWNRLKEDLEQRIQTLSGTTDHTDGHRVAALISGNHTSQRGIEDMETDTPASTVDLPADLKIEPTNEVYPDQTSHPSIVQQDSAADLREEIRRLRERCTEVENALHIIRNESRSMEGLIKVLLERADSALRD